MKKISKQTQRLVSGGKMLEDGGLGEDAGSSTMVRCTTPGGTQSWKRRCSGSSDATAICRSIYPAYGDNVSGVCVTVHPTITVTA